MRATRRTWLAAGALALLPGCLTFVWSRALSFEPLPEHALDGLEPGRSKLSDCLARLGAPLYVWEYRREGAALAWGHGDARARRISLAIPVDRVRPTFSYGDVDAKLSGAVLLFDEDLVLVEVKEGCLRDIAKAIGPARPATVGGGSSEPSALDPLP